MHNTPEFVDTYSDDLLYLMDFRDSHLTHPGKRVTKSLFEASITRIFCAFMIGNIEAMIDNWRERDGRGILDAYFLTTSNEDRLRALADNFRRHGINVDDIILKRYLAIKYVRNTIIHSKWKENNHALVLEMGFPTDTRQLNEEHLQLMYETNVEMMKYIAATEIHGFSEARFNTTLPEYRKYFNKNDLKGFLWNNLERIDHEIGNNKESSDYLIKEAIYDWGLFKEIALNGQVDYDGLDDHINILTTLISQKKFSQVPIGYLDIAALNPIGLKKEEKLNSISEILNVSPNEVEPFMNAFKNGEKCYNIIVNITASSLLKKISEMTHFSEITHEAALADKLFKLGRAYYNYAEQNAY